MNYEIGDEVIVQPFGVRGKIVDIKYIGLICQVKVQTEVFRITTTTDKIRKVEEQ